MLNRLLGLPESASEHGFLIDHMLEVCHWFMLALFVGWSTFFFFTLFKFHKSRHPKADYHGIRTDASTHIEFMVVIIEAVILLGFALPLWAKRVTQFPNQKDANIVRVTGQQFTWIFHYPGADNVFGKQDLSLISSANDIGLDAADAAAKDDVVARNELHLLVDKPVILEIGSKDVIHSLSLQSMYIGQDAIPGTITPIWFTPKKAGQYEIICGQLCGLGHYGMRALMYVDTPQQYADWQKENAPSVSAAASPAVVPAPGAGSPSVPVPSKTGSLSVENPATASGTPGQQVPEGQKK